MLRDSAGFRAGAGDEEPQVGDVTPRQGLSAPWDARDKAALCLPSRAQVCLAGG